MNKSTSLKAAFRHLLHACPGQEARSAGRQASLQTATLGLTGAGLLYVGLLGGSGKAELWSSLGLATLAARLGGTAP